MKYIPLTFRIGVQEIEEKTEEEMLLDRVVNGDEELDKYKDGEFKFYQYQGYVRSDLIASFHLGGEGDFTEVNLTTGDIIFANETPRQILTLLGDA